MATSGSAFNFEDQYGSDPIMRRYVGSSGVTPGGIRASEMDVRISAARQQEAEANLRLSQAQLAAQLAPMRQAQEVATGMSQLLKTKNDLQRNASVQGGAAVINEGLSNVTDLDSTIKLGVDNPYGLEDEFTGNRWKQNVLGGLQRATDMAANESEVLGIYSKLPASVASEPAFQTARDNAVKQAQLRESLGRRLGGAVPSTPTGTVDISAANQQLGAQADAFRKSVMGATSVDEVRRKFSELPTEVAYSPVMKSLQSEAEQAAKEREDILNDVRLTNFPVAAGGGLDVSAARRKVSGLNEEDRLRKEALQVAQLVRPEISKLASSIQESSATAVEPIEGTEEWDQLQEQKARYNELLSTFNDAMSVITRKGTTARSTMGTDSGAEKKDNAGKSNAAVDAFMRDYSGTQREMDN